MNLVIITSVTVFLIAISFGVMALKLVNPGGAKGASLEWLDEFSTTKYVPMQRLLDGADFAFLAAQAGGNMAAAKRLRAEHKRIFGEYMRQLNGDFHRLVTLANVMVVCSNEDRAELAHDIWNQRMNFYRAFCALRLDMALAPFGLAVPDVSALLGTLGDMQSRVRSLTPVDLLSAA